MTEQRPNIIIFNPDQWRGDVMGHLGNQAAQTPVLDNLVKEDAVSFRHAFCQNPVCTPSRASFLTGWYPHTKGHRTMYHLLHSECGEPNLLKILKDTGYFVGWFGKNDAIGSLEDIEDSCSIRYVPKDEDYKRWGHKKYPSKGAFEYMWRGEPKDDTYYSFYVGKVEPDEDEKDGIWFDGDCTNVWAVRDFITNHNDSDDADKPFCIFLPLHDPHVPYAAEEPWFSQIDRTKIPERAPTPMSDGEEYWKDKPSILKGIWERQNMQTWTEERWTELRATYYAQCSRVDNHLGLIIDELKKQGIYDNTAIFILSDHGDYTGDYGLVEKNQNTFEDCLSNVPFIIKPPKNLEIMGHVNESLVELVDMSATIYDMLGINPEYTYFGESLINVMKEQRNECKKAVYCEGGRLMNEMHCSEIQSINAQSSDGHYWPRVNLQAQKMTEENPYHTKAAMCRTKKLKYVQRLYEKDELYDLVEDPFELKNVIDHADYNERLEKMKDLMLDWHMKTSDAPSWKVDQRDYR